MVFIDIEISTFLDVIMNAKNHEDFHSKMMGYDKSKMFLRFITFLKVWLQTIKPLC